MSLKSRFASQFNPKIRDRGVAYFRAGAVKILDYYDGYLLTRVEGTFDYFVELSLNVNSLDVACTCPETTAVVTMHHKAQLTDWAFGSYSNLVRLVRR